MAKKKINIGNRIIYDEFMRELEQEEFLNEQAPANPDEEDVSSAQPPSPEESGDGEEAIAPPPLSSIEEPKPTKRGRKPKSDSGSEQDSEESLPPPVESDTSDSGEETEEKSDEEQGPIEYTDAVFGEFIQNYLLEISKSPTDKEKLREILLSERQKDGLSTLQSAFIDMNISALSLLDVVEVVDSQKSIRKETEIEPMISIFEDKIESSLELTKAIIRFSGLGPDRSNMFRQLLAICFGGAVVPGITGGEVNFIPKKEKQAKKVRPVASSSWGMIDMGPITIGSESIKTYLGDDGESKLESGSPEERRVLRNRLVIEAISDQIGGSVYYVIVCDGKTGQWESVILQSDLFRDGYESGKLVVVESDGDNSDSFGVDQDGNLIPIAKWGIALVNSDESSVDIDTGEKNPKKKVIARIEQGRLIWMADGEDMRAIGLSVSSHEPSKIEQGDSPEISRSVPNARAKLFGVMMYE